MKINEKDKTFSMNVYGTEHTFRLVQNRYAETNGLALLLEINYDGCWEAYCNLTVNLGRMPKDKVCLDKNNLEDMWNNIQELIEDNNLGTITREEIPSGFCLYPVFEINPEAIKKYCV